MSIRHKNHTRQKALQPSTSSFALSMGLAIVSPFLIAAYCWEPSSTSSTVSSGLAQLDANVIGEITKQTLGYTNTIKDNTAVINEAIKVSTSQEALSAVQIGKADRNAKQLEVAALAAQKTADNYVQVQLDYGATTGQGHNVCQVYTENKQLADALESTEQVAANKVLNTDNAPGRIVSSNKQALEQREEIHKSNFCSQEEVDNGTCSTASPVPGGDSNANLLFVSSSPGTKVSAAKAAVRQNILGSPNLSIPKAAGQTVVGQAYLANVNRKTALSAFPAYSLAYLESMSEKRDDLKDVNGNPQSPNDALFNTVTRYYGGPEAKNWTKSMIAQQPRGLLVELAKMEGLGAYMDNQEYLANQRLEGNIAAMTIISTLPMEEVLIRQERSLKNKQRAAALR